MSNMSYCRFENTSNDLADCVEAMEEAEGLNELDLSAQEKYAMTRMRRQAERFIAQFDFLVNQEEMDRITG